MANQKQNLESWIRIYQYATVNSNSSHPCCCASRKSSSFSWNELIVGFCLFVHSHVHLDVGVFITIITRASHFQNYVMLDSFILIRYRSKWRLNVRTKNLDASEVRRVTSGGELYRRLFMMKSRSNETRSGSRNCWGSGQRSAQRRNWRVGMTARFLVWAWLSCSLTMVIIYVYSLPCRADDGFWRIRKHLCPVPPTRWSRWQTPLAASLRL